MHGHAWSCELYADNVCLFVCLLLQAPINDNKACVSLMGIKSTTKKTHIVRAILESIAYR